jgi:hypothetical protein
VNRGGAKLGYSLLILLALGGTLALAGQSRSPASATLGVATSAVQQLGPDQLARISVDATPGVARRVERVRGLRFRRLPEPEVVSSAFLNRLAIRQLERQPGGLGIGADDAVGRITGLLEPDEELEAAYTSTGDLAAAAYDPKTKRLYVVSDAVAANRELVEFVLAHELDHALEDQNFGLGGGASLSDDAALAKQALDEGSATDVMIEFAARYLDPLALLAATETIDSGTGDVPKAFVDQLTWTYLGGRRFVAELRELAGSWKLVDYALETRPPVSTEQVLHPRRYVLDERPSTVRIDGAALRERGWRLADRNVFGELATTYLLQVGADQATAKAAAAGWDGDRYELWRRDVAPGACEYPCREDLALVAKWRWDTRADRDQFDAAAQAYVDGIGGMISYPRSWFLDQESADRGSGPGVAIRSGALTTTIAFAPDLILARRAAGLPAVPHLG